MKKSVLFYVMLSLMLIQIFIGCASVANLSEGLGGLNQPEREPVRSGVGADI